VSPGAWLTDVTQDRYEVREKKCSRKVGIHFRIIYIFDVDVVHEIELIFISFLNSCSLLLPFLHDFVIYNSFHLFELFFYNILATGVYV